MEIIVISLIKLGLVVLQLFSYCVIAQAIMSWLLAFGIMNDRNQVVYRLGVVLEAIVDPFLRPLRRFIPILGGVDITPVILLLVVWFLQNLLEGFLFRF